MPNNQSLEHDDPSEVDKKAAEYRQGDVVDLARMAYLDIATDPSKPAAVVKAEAEANILVTQTCDIVRDSSMRPYVQVAPLAVIEDEIQAAACREGAEPRFVWVPGLGDHSFADLDVIQTITKRLLVRHTPRRGLRNDEQQRTFARAVGRKLDRFAFPNDLAPALSKLRDRIVKKWDKEASAEGRMLQQVRQIRAEVDDWNAAKLSVALTFIVKAGVLPHMSDPPVPSEAARSRAKNNPMPHQLAEQLEATTARDDRAWLWDRLVEAWVGTCKHVGKINEITGEAVSEDEYAVNRYWKSSALDVDYLSGPTEE